MSIVILDTCGVLYDSIIKVDHSVASDKSICVFSTTDMVSISLDESLYSIGCINQYEFYCEMFYEPCERCLEIGPELVFYVIRDKALIPLVNEHVNPNIVIGDSLNDYDNYNGNKIFYDKLANVANFKWNILDKESYSRLALHEPRVLTDEIYSIIGDFIDVLMKFSVACRIKSTRSRHTD